MSDEIVREFLVEGNENLDTLDRGREKVNPETSEMLRRRMSELGSLPVMPSILQSLRTCLSASAGELDIARIVELISYDKSLAAQCLRMANSAMFSGRARVQSVRQAVLALGIQRVRDIVYSCSLPQIFAGGARHGMEQETLWRHALGTALVGQHLGELLLVSDTEKLYLAGLLHDIGILVNSLLYPEEFQRVLRQAEASETPLSEVEREILGFTHCESGRVLADLWKLPADIADTIEFHHHPSGDDPDEGITCVVYLADVLCRLRGLGYGYYEAREFDLAAEIPWQALRKNHPEAAAGLDLARFTFELDQYGVEVQMMVDSIFSGATVPH
jgi:HD-like signal output (HDOD) protein